MTESNEGTNTRTKNERTDKRQGENYITRGINARGIKTWLRNTGYLLIQVHLHCNWVQGTTKRWLLKEVYPLIQCPLKTGLSVIHIRAHNNYIVVAQLFCTLEPPPEHTK